MFAITHSTLLRGASALALAVGFLAVQTEPAKACSIEPLIGSVCIMATGYCPVGFLPADGRQMAINQNQALFALLGTRFGGDAKTTFNLPDMRSRVPVGATLGGTPPAPLTPLQVGQKRGAEAVVLSSSQTGLVAHTHTTTFTPVTGPSQITIPAQAGSGTALTGTGSIDIVAGVPTASPPGVSNPVAGTTYSLTGGKAAAPSSLTGPYTTATPTTGSTASVGNVKVNVDASNMVPASPQRTIDVTAVTGGTVSVAPAGQNAALPVSTVNPQLVLTYCIATTGSWPEQP